MAWVLEFIKIGLICQTTIPSNITSETISSKLRIKSEKWIFFSLCRPKEFNVSTYDGNVVVMNDFNNDVKEVTNKSPENLNFFLRNFWLVRLGQRLHLLS